MPSRIGLRELRAAAERGECPFCGDPAKPKSQSPDAVRKRARRGSSDFHAHCGDEECARAYGRYYKRNARSSSLRAVVGRKYRPSGRGDGKLVVYAEELECGHVRPYNTVSGEWPSEVRQCKQCALTTRTEQLR